MSSLRNIPVQFKFFHLSVFRHYTFMRILIQACRIIYLFIKRELDFNRRITWLLSIFANRIFAFFKLNNYYKIINNAKQDENTSFRNTTRTDGFQTSFLTFLVNGGIHCIQRFGRVIKSKRAGDSYKNSTTVWSSKVTFRTVWRRFPYRFALKCRIGFGSPASKHVQFLDSERTQNVSKPESQMIIEKWSRNNRRSKQCQTWISERVKRKSKESFRRSKGMECDNGVVDCSAYLAVYTRLDRCTAVMHACAADDFTHHTQLYTSCQPFNG